MLKFEYNMLVLNSIFSDDDVEEINKFADYIRNQEQERIIALLNDRARELGDCPCDDNCEIVRAGVLLAIGDIALIKGENE